MGVPAPAGAAPAPAEENAFDWTTSIEPHAARRRAILAKYGPEVRALYGTDPWTGVQVRAAEREMIEERDACAPALGGGAGVERPNRKVPRASRRLAQAATSVTPATLPSFWTETQLASGTETKEGRLPWPSRSAAPLSLFAAAPPPPPPERSGE